MNIQLQYKFPSEQLAYRFLNTVAHLDAEELKVKFGQTDHHVRVNYKYKQGQFDNVASQLDDLAARMEGEEV
ncbi:hypothetical protein OPS25_09010 [Alteromonas ponticola]|uniref:Uncharacterized protein n=1 Tax=Alteromonas aquimaris TaxID=2998417 RepID=A0ABT3P788_9ALTE|nr:hypothetical protein [Alteromonas aquimaris]MCW8108633.1 hypothetical protein [Alteromonas aquimaris]